MRTPQRSQSEIEAVLHTFDFASFGIEIDQDQHAEWVPELAKSIRERLDYDGPQENNTHPFRF